MTTYKCPKCDINMEIYDEEITFFDFLKIGLFFLLMGLTIIGFIEISKLLGRIL